MSVELEINSKTIRAPQGPTLFDLAEELGIRVPNSCCKQGKCRECLMEIVEGMEHLSAPTPQERHLRGNFRLSCRTRIESNQGVVRCHTLRRGALRIEVEAHGLSYPRTDWKPDPSVVRDGNSVLLDGEKIDRTEDSLYGIAMDLGTTTVVLRLVNLESGKVVATQSFENPQRFGGSDVMARIRYDSEQRGRLLHRTLLGYLAHAIDSLPCNPRSIYEMTVAGNPTMRDLFFGLRVETIGQKPYWSSTEHEFRQGRRKSTSLSTKARKLRLPIHPEARVYGLPLIGGHVGSDAAACLLAIDLPGETRTVALMDIGTNTELIVGNGKRAVAASCPAGPAFEGGGLTCGMPGLEGAIEGIRLGEDGEIQTQIIGFGAAQGICGSGLVELLSELLRTGKMNPLGRFTNYESRFLIDDKHQIHLNESDISLLAQAKGANVAGLHIALRNYGIDFKDLDVFYLAGGFGRHLSLDAARRIGLIPDLAEERIVQIGNASIEGATIALLSVSRRRTLEDFVKTIRHLELETDPSFFEYFVEGCQYSPVRTTSLSM